MRAEPLAALGALELLALRVEGRASVQRLRELLADLRDARQRLGVLFDLRLGSAPRDGERFHRPGKLAIPLGERLELLRRVGLLIERVERVSAFVYHANELTALRNLFELRAAEDEKA